MPGNGVLVQQPAQGVHVFLGTPAFGTVVQAFLQVVHGDVGNLHVPDRAKILHSGPVSIHGRLSRPVGGLPGFIELIKADGPQLGLHADLWQIVQGLLFCLKSGLGAGHPLQRTVRPGFVAHGFYRNPSLIGQLVHAALAVSPVFWLMLYLLAWPRRDGRICFHPGYQRGICGISFDFPPKSVKTPSVTRNTRSTIEVRLLLCVIIKIVC